MPDTHVVSAPEKALPHVVTGLIAKRAELAGRIEHLQAQVRQATVELDHVEATLRIFQPDIDLGTIGARPVPPIHHAFKGETTRVVLETIRLAGRPVDTTAITEAVMKARGLDRNDVAMFRLMSKRVGACLRHWEKQRGVIHSIPGAGQVKLWELVQSIQSPSKGLLNLVDSLGSYALFRKLALGIPQWIKLRARVARVIIQPVR